MEINKITHQHLRSLKTCVKESNEQKTEMDYSLNCANWIFIISKILLLLLLSVMFFLEEKKWLIGNGCHTFWVPFRVCGYHYFHKYLEPKSNQELDCAPGVDNPYDYFLIKTCKRGRNDGTVGHLNMEFSRPTKYISERAATVVAKLSSTNYRRSPLVQGGLEISYCVAIFMPEALKKKEIIQKYKDMLDIMYTTLSLLKMYLLVRLCIILLTYR